MRDLSTNRSIKKNIVRKKAITLAVDVEALEFPTLLKEGNICCAEDGEHNGGRK
jgi:hypothetical protein